jgi:hypothetical protein
MALASHGPPRTSADSVCLQRLPEARHAPAQPVVERRFPQPVRHREQQHQARGGDRRPTRCDARDHERRRRNAEPGQQRPFERRRYAAVAPGDEQVHGGGHHRERQEDGAEQDEGLGERQRHEHLALGPGHGEHGQEADDGRADRGQDRAADLARAAEHHFQPRLTGVRLLQVLEHVFGHDHAHVDDRADGDRDAGQRHHVGVHADQLHQDETDQHGQRQRGADHQRRAQVQHHDDDHHDGHQHLLHQRVVQGAQRLADQPRAVVEGHDLELAERGPVRPLAARGAAQPVQPGLLVERRRAEGLEALARSEALHLAALYLQPVDDCLGGQPRAECPDLRLDVLDGAQRVVALAHDHDAAHRLGAADGERSAALRRPEIDHGHVAHPDGDEVRPDPHHRLLKIGEAVDETEPAHQVFDAVDFDDARADVQVALAHRIEDLLQRDPVRAQRVGIDVDLVLAHEAADGGHLADALRGEQAVAHVPVLHAAQLVEIPAADRPAVGIAPLQRVPVHLAQRGGVRTQGGRHAVRQEARRQAVQLLEDARARPVELGLFVEDQEDHREAERGAAADFLHAGHTEQRDRQRIGHLVLDVLRRTAGPLGEHDLLVLAEVRNGVHRHRVARHPIGVPVERRNRDARADDRQHQQGHDELLLEEKADHAVEQGTLSVAAHEPSPACWPSSASVSMIAPQRSIAAP